MTRLGHLYLPLDVEFMDDDRIIEAGEKAGWLYVAMLLRSKRLASDGFLTFNQVERIPVSGKPGRLAQLLAVRLIVEEHGGYRITGWAKHNKLAAEVQAKLDRKAAASRKGNHQRWHVDVGKSDPNCELCSEPESEPESVVGSDVGLHKTETETETETVPSEKAPPKHTIPPNWQPSQADLAWAKAEFPNVNLDVETANFVDYFLDKAEKRPGWSRSWKRWIREASQRRRPLRAVNDRDPQYAWDV